jgi:hypothetical protein
MKLDQLAFGLFRRAYHAVLASPGDADAHKRFEKWAKLVSRIVGLPITGCHETHGPVRDRWVSVTAAALLAAITTHYFAGVLLNPSKPEKPAPSRAAIGQLMATASVSSMDTGSGYFWNTVTGQQFLGLPPLPRKPPTRDT